MSRPNRERVFVRVFVFVGDTVVSGFGGRRALRAHLHDRYGSGGHRDLQPALLLQVLQGVRREAPRARRQAVACGAPRVPRPPDYQHSYHHVRAAVARVALRSVLRTVHYNSYTSLSSWVRADVTGTRQANMYSREHLWVGSSTRNNRQKRQ